jgi:pyridoxamine 5'-phosphate oxidase-like protein
VLGIPGEVEAVFREFRTCEFSTLARDGTPVTWPMLPFWRPDTGQFLTTTSIGLADKALNIRRNPRVSLLFSDSTGSRLTNPPAVLVQSDAVAPDTVQTSIGSYEREVKLVYRRQPSGAIWSSNPLMRWYFDWYFMRLEIVVTPLRILWWTGGDVSARPSVLELAGVA